MQLPAAGLIYIENKKLLLAFSKNKACFYLPGGKVDAGETAMDALCRELQEELQVRIEKNDLSFYTHITAPALGEKKGTIMEQDCFLLQKRIIPHAAAEIGALEFFSLQDYQQQPLQAPGVLMVLEQLTAEGLVNK